ncbi:hypothetical protein I4U23_015299 [Adineta vaga]|nr:hypothetical protein I4U23_015299 [Adineta vaga]
MMTYVLQGFLHKIEENLKCVNYITCIFIFESHPNNRKYSLFADDYDLSSSDSDYTISDTELEQIRSEARRYSFSILPATLPLL